MSKMKIRATKTMANAIAEAMGKLGMELEEVSLVKMLEGQFSFQVGDPFMECEDCDYDWEDCTYKVIRVVYPYNYYAMPCYLSTNRLKRIFRRSDGTFE